MKTTVATAIAGGRAEDASRTLATTVQGKLAGVDPVILMVFSSTAQSLGEMVRALGAQFPKATIFGASTAGEFTEARDGKGTSALFALGGDFRVFGGMGTDLKKDPEAAIHQSLEGLPEHVRGFPHRTGVLLLDPLAGNGEEATLLASSVLGPDVPLVGGAAGDDLKMSSTEVAFGNHSVSDAMVLGVIFSKTPLGIGVSHGHEPLSPPLRVTRASGNVLAELDGRRAWDVWLEHTRERAATHGLDVGSMSPDQEGGYLLRYEAGLATGAAYKVRAPLSRNSDGSINFACGIVEGSVIRITESTPERQIRSARRAARTAREKAGGAPAAGALVFDCICRNLILGDQFLEAVKGMSEELGGAPLAGFETYGEIALEVGDMSGFHNTTSVVLAFPTS